MRAHKHAIDYHLRITHSTVAANHVRILWSAYLCQAQHARLLHGYSWGGSGVLLSASEWFWVVLGGSGVVLGWFSGGSRVVLGWFWGDSGGFWGAGWIWLVLWGLGWLWVVLQSSGWFLGNSGVVLGGYRILLGWLVVAEKRRANNKHRGSKPRHFSRLQMYRNLLQRSTAHPRTIRGMLCRGAICRRMLCHVTLGSAMLWNVKSWNAMM